MLLFMRDLHEILGCTKQSYHLIPFNEVWGFMGQFFSFAALTISLG